MKIWPASWVGVGIARGAPGSLKSMQIHEHICAIRYAKKFEVRPNTPMHTEVCGGLNSLRANRRTLFVEYRPRRVCGIRGWVCGIRRRLGGVEELHFEVENGARDLQNEAREVIGEPLGRRGRSGIDFIDFLMVFGRLLGSILRVFSHKIRIEFSMSFLEAFWRHFGFILEPFGVNFGGSLA